MQGVSVQFVLSVPVFLSAAASPPRNRRAFPVGAMAGFGPVSALPSAGPVVQPIAPPLKGDDLDVVEEAVEDRRGTRHIPKKLASVLDRTVARHDRATGLMKANDDLEKVFAAAFGVLLRRQPLELLQKPRSPWGRDARPGHRQIPVGALKPATSSEPAGKSAPWPVLNPPPARAGRLKMDP
jgi:hypothetical protein